LTAIILVNERYISRVPNLPYSQAIFYKGSLYYNHCAGSHLNYTIPIVFYFRNDRDILTTLSRRGQAPVSADQGLTISQQSGCVLYVETTSKLSGRSAISVFEVAALAKYGHLSRRNRQNEQTSHNMSMSMMSLGPSQQFIPTVSKTRLKIASVLK
jgi:hypothetical protein